MAQPDKGGVKLDPEKKAIKEIQRLTTIDFPKSFLRINEDGSVNLK